MSEDGVADLNPETAAEPATPRKRSRRKTEAEEPPPMSPPVEPTSSMPPPLDGLPQGGEAEPAAGFVQMVESRRPDRPARHEGPVRNIVRDVSHGFRLDEDFAEGVLVFKFDERPEQHVVDRLVSGGWRYHSRPKVWTIETTAASREDAVRLAREFAGPDQGRTPF
jgi:hypothetical protein